MSLSSGMSSVVRSIASADSVRRQALKSIRGETGRYLAGVRVSRHRMAVAQLAQRSEAVRTTRLTTAMVLGAAAEMIDVFQRERGPRTVALRRDLIDGAKRLRAHTYKRLSMESAARRKATTKNRRERLVVRTALHNDVADMSKRFRSFVATLTKDRRAAAGVWHTHVNHSLSVGQTAPVKVKDVQGQATPAQAKDLQGQTTSTQAKDIQGQAAPAQAKSVQGQAAPAQAKDVQGQAAKRAPDSTAAARHETEMKREPAPTASVPPAPRPQTTPGS